jgi:dihydroorotate dehydrogenase
VIWIKRAAPLLLIALLWLGWSFISDYRENMVKAEDARMAQLSAQVWVAGAKYRNDIPKYLAYRDSLLQANGLTDSGMKVYAASIEQQIDRQLLFANLVKSNVDSLVKVEDSLVKAADIAERDSVKQADSVKVLGKEARPDTATKK